MQPSRRVTIKEVALKAGVSYQTVSKLLNGQINLLPATEERIWQAVRELDYHPSSSASSLRSRRSRTLGYSWAPAPPNHSNHILDMLLSSMLFAVESVDYHLLCFPQHREPGTQLKAFRNLYETGRVDGFILSSVEYNDPRVLYLLEKKIPFTAFGRSNPDLTFPCIDVDGGDGLRQAVLHLAERGHTRIAALCWPESSRVGNNRLVGFIAGLEQAGLPLLSELIMRGEGSLDFGYKATNQLMALPEDQRPTAFVTLNDPMGVGCMRALRDIGLIPGRDAAVTGFDDTPIAQFTYPPLTSVRQPTWEVGQRLVSRVLSELNNGLDTTSPAELLLPQLVVRESTAPELMNF